MHPVIQLKKGREVPLSRRHPWIFSGAVHRIDGHPNDGDRVIVANHLGQQLAWGHFHDGSILVKVVSFGGAPPSDQPLTDALEAAWALRQYIGYGPGTETTGFRLVHGEGDHLPGLIIDIYNTTAVFQAHSIGMYRERESIIAALLKLDGLPISHVFDKSRTTLPPHFASTIRDGYMYGEDGENHFTEYGIPFLAQWDGGQKTGFFLDQRENRKLLQRYSAGMSVLNAFSYSGGFSIYALKGGATEVTSVDVSAKALTLLEANLSLSELNEQNHISVEADVLNYLREHEQVWDIVILDPPAFAKSMNKRHQAVQGYKRLNALGMKRVRPGGLLFTFSCSQVVDTQLFRDTITAAALEAGREAKILHVLSQGPDHPVNLVLPETSYLKGLVLEIR